MKKFAILAIVALVAGSAFAQGWWLATGQTGVTIGGNNFDITAWSTDADNGTDLGTLTSLTLSAASLSYWRNQDPSYQDDNTGMNLYFNLYDASGNKLNDSAVDVWLGGGSYVSNSEHDYAINSTSLNADLLDTSTLTDGATYGVEMWAKIYGNSGDTYINGGEGAPNYHASFTYSASSGAVPEPATMSLLGLGALALVLRRKLSK